MYLSKNRKSGIYYIYFRQDNGKKTRLSTRTTFKSEALKFLNDFEKKLKAKELTPSISIKKFAVQYLNTISITHTKSSYRSSKNSLDKFVEFVGADTLIKDITHSIAEKFILTTYQRAKHHAAQQLRHLKAAFNVAIAEANVERGFIQNPFKNIKLRIPEKTPVFINENELNLILTQEKNPTLRNIYQFAFFTGMRISEILNLIWGSVAQRSNVIKVSNTESFTTKSKRERVVPISKSVFNIFNEMKWGEGNNLNDYVFTKNSAKFNSVYVSKQFKKCVRSANLNDSIHFHTLRHSFASNLVQKGGSIYLVQKLLGHSQISTTQKYAHFNNESLQKVLDLLN